MTGTGVTDEIKSKLDIVQVISEYLPLKKAGSAWKAPCPFHSEKSPSFMVNTERQRFHCFGCGEDGDIFGFVMRIEGLDFPEALRVLAKKAGVILRQEDAEMGNAKQLLMDINRWAARFWHEVLLKSPQAERARAYVQKRALQNDTVEDWIIGYAPDAWETTLQFLRKKGYKDDDIFHAGLVTRSDRGSGYFDRFRNRLMFAIRDVHGNVVGFTGRVMPDASGADPKDTAKYVNTQQTLVYNKSAILFGLDKAKQEIRKKGLAVVVEGNMDVIASHQAGVTNVVASSGTAFTGEQLHILKRYTNKLVLSFDNDAAGENAARRSIDAAVAAGFVVRMLRLPPGAGKDPDDCIRKNPEAWSKAIANAVPFMDWFIDLVKERTDMRDPEAKREAADMLLKEIAKMIDPVEQSHWTRVLTQLFETPESLLFEKLKKMRPIAAAQGNQQPTNRSAPTVLRPKTMTRWSLVSEFVLAIMAAWPEYADAVIASLMPEFLDPEYEELYREYVVSYNAGRKAGANAGSSRIPADILDNRDYADKIAVLELRAQKEFGELSSEERRDAIVKLTGELKRLHVTHRQFELTRAMAEAEKTGDGQKIKEIQEQINELLV